jgi:Zn-dependent metalloprotease
MKRSSANQSATATVESHTQTARHFLDTVQTLLHLDNPAQELTLKSNRTDTMGKRHLRFDQYYQDIPVWNCTLTVHLNKAGDVELVDGAFFPSPNKVSTQPVYTADQAIEKAQLSIPHGADAVETDSPQLVIYPEPGQQPRLAWEIKLSTALDSHWLVLVNADSGAKILAYNQVADVAIAGSGQDLLGNQQQLNIFEDINRFVMVDTSKPMFQGGSPFPISTDKGAIYVFDDKNQSAIDNEGNVDLPRILKITSSQNPNSGWPQAAVSAAVTLSATYDYYSEVHQRDSIDGNGGSIFALVRVGNNYNNAFWNGQIIAFGDAQAYPAALDVVGHELTHGVTTSTANLIYLNQSGALNEAFSDILGEAIEAHTFGQADWVNGAQLGTPLRSLRNPGSIINTRTGKPYPATMSEFVQLPATPKGDHGGVHINSSIINHAFYLLAEGMNGAIGIDAAEQIFYRALVFHLVPRSQFIDARLALIQSATEIFGEGSVQALKTGEAFDAVEIFDAPPTPDNSTPTIINGPDATTFLRLTPTGAIALNRLDPALEDPETGVIHSSFSLDEKRPSVSRNGSLIAFINSNHELCLINSVNNLDESCLEQTATFNSVAISPDGNKLALVLLNAIGNPEDQILIIDTSPNGQNQRIDLVAAATDNASTISLSHADAMDFSNDGNILIYDALNEIAATDGSRISAWSIYALDLVNETTITVIPPVSGFNFGFPSLSQTTDNYLAFDAFNQTTQTNTVTTASLITGESRSIDTSSIFGTPSFTGDDSSIVYSRPDATTNTGASLFKQALSADHITPAGASELWLKNADFGVIYRRGDTTTNGDGLDIDGNGELDALTDGLLVIRYLFGLTGDSLTTNAVASNCTRCGNTEIESFLGNLSFLDVDKNGSNDALTDGLLVIRYVFGLTGEALTSEAVASNCTRCSHTEIESFLDGL